MSGGTLTPPDLAYDAEGVPRSARYGDLYHSAEDGLAEAEHVFVAGNELHERFARLRPGDGLTIAELGLGTGLNVMAALAAFSERGHSHGHLCLWSVEAHPLGRAAFAASAGRIAGRWPRVAGAARALADAYPDPVPGQAALRLGEDATLVLAFGEAEPALRDARLAADAWFLDGFSPDRNPAMWSDGLLRLVAERSVPGATAATFTVAGAVRRGLAAAGFEVRKTPGFGHKREMTRARLPGEEPAPAALRVAVLGAGIAGASAAWHLRRRGAAVTVFDPAGPAAGASGNPVGLVTPRLEAQDSPVARLYRDAYAYAARLYAAEASAAILSHGAELRVEAGRRDKLLSLSLWSEGALVACEGGLLAPGALCIDPAAAVRSLLASVQAVRARPTLTPAGGRWRASADGASWPCDAVVIASGPAARALDLGVPVLRASRGQIDLFAARPPARIVSGDGYVAPAGNRLAAGATYGPADPGAVPAPDEAGSRANAEVAARLTGASPGASVAARAALRAVTPDRHPLFGGVAGFDGAGGGPSLLVLGGLGSRGLSTAPLLGLAAAALLAGDPSPLTRPQAAVIDPDRFARRAARRR